MGGWRKWIGGRAGVGLALLGMAGIAVPPVADQAADARQFEKQFHPLLTSHCAGCHSGDKPKGNLRLPSATPDFADAAVRKQWTVVVKRLQAGEMPPKGKERPPEQEVKALTDWLLPRLAAAEQAARAAQGRVVLRRLNRA